LAWIFHKISPMRVPRKILISENSGIVHEYWRCHNKDFLLNSDSVKSLYLRSTKTGLTDRKSDGQIQLHAFCIMDNHSHQVLQYSGGVDLLSRFMRVSHSEFGRRLNRLFNRSGAVGNARPGTSVIQETAESQMRAHMYVEANPIRAGKRTLENLKYYSYSSYRFYAYGIIDEFTQMLTPPEWYLQLGSTPEERQEQYRILFAAYVGEGRPKPREYFARFFGDVSWRIERALEITMYFRSIRIAPS
jgi:putative transposase